MNDAIPASGLQLRSTVRSDGRLHLALASTPIPELGPDEVLMRVEASPINPSDLGLLLGGADLSTAVAEAGPSLSAPVPEARLRWFQARLDQPLPVGNEGAGLIVAAGASPEAQSLLGRTGAGLGGAMYAQYRVLRASDVLVLPEGVTAREGASAFVNPLTVIGMVETMRAEGHEALVHTAAASNLGQMLQRFCLEEGVALVNIVRSAAQAQRLKDLGARHVVNSSDPDFVERLTDALVETRATIGFDAIGGGRLASDILASMEVAALRRGAAAGGYGSSVHKQVYIYGGLDFGPTQLFRAYGMAWGIGGWLLPYFLQKIGPDAAAKLRRKVAEGLKTTFASSYTAELSLGEVLDPAIARAYGRMATGEKYLVTPQKPLAG